MLVKEQLMVRLFSQSFTPEAFRCDFVSASLITLRNIFMDTCISLICRTGHEDVSHTCMITLMFKLT